MTTKRTPGRSRLALVGAVAAVALLGAACNGNGDDEGEPVPGTPTATIEGIEGTETSPEATEPATETETATPTEEATPPEASSGDACADLHMDAGGNFVFLANVGSGDALASGTTVEGCSQTWEANVVWRLLDREGNVLADGFTMGGSIDGHATFEFDVEYEVDEAQVGHLFVEADDPSDGEGFPPVVNQVPVVLQP